MQISKLYNLVDDIVIEEGRIGFDSKIQTIINSLNTLNSNRNNPAVQEQLDKNLEELKNLLHASHLNTLTPSYQKIVDNIGGDKYFGIQISNTIDKIISTQAFNITLISQNLTKLKTERTAYINLIRTLNATFEKLDINPHYWSEPHTFEIGYIIPENITDAHRVPLVTKQLKKWNQFIITIKEITGQEIDDCRISMQDTGSLQFFFENAEVTATIVVTAIERLAALYKRILEIRKLRADLKKYDFPKNEQKTIEKHENKTAEDEIKEIVDDVFKDHGKKRFEGGRRNELKNAFSLHLKWLAKQLDSGASVEVNTPNLPEVEKMEGESDASLNKRIKKYDEQKTKYDVISSKVSLIKTFADTSNEVFKYLNPSNENDEQEK